MELTIELIRAFLNLPGLVGWQITLCEKCLTPLEDGQHPDPEDEEELLDLVQSRWVELLERGAV
jgi:hypothetical protein